MYLEIFLADFAVFWEFRGISRKYLNFPGPRLREISEALAWAWIYGSYMTAIKPYLRKLWNITIQ